jgi:hypothetical protein
MPELFVATPTSPRKFSESFIVGSYARAPVAAKWELLEDLTGRCRPCRAYARRTWRSKKSS